MESITCINDVLDECIEDLLSEFKIREFYCDNGFYQTGRMDSGLKLIFYKPKISQLFWSLFAYLSTFEA